MGDIGVFYILMTKTFFRSRIKMKICKAAENEVMVEQRSLTIQKIFSNCSWKTVKFNADDVTKTFIHNLCRLLKCIIHSKKLQSTKSHLQRSKFQTLQPHVIHIYMHSIKVIVLGYSHNVFSNIIPSQNVSTLLKTTRDENVLRVV